MANKKAKPSGNVTFSIDGTTNETMVKDNSKNIFKTVLTEMEATTNKLTPKQHELVKLLNNPKNKIIIIKGPAGTAKTYTVCYYAILSLCMRQYDKIILTKPLEEAGEKVGYLPGDLADKINPFFQSFKSNIEKMLSPDRVQKLFEKKNIEYQPLAFMRGNSYDKTLQILDEIQNSDIRQLIMFVTRMGQNSKVVLMGDEMQYDIPNRLSGINHMIKMTQGMEGVAHFSFTREDIMRDKILIELTLRYEKYLEEQNRNIENKKGAGR